MTNRTDIIREVQEIERAKLQTRAVLGNDPLAFDAVGSAAEIYERALRKMGVNLAGVRHPDAFQQIFEARRDMRSGRAAPRVAPDAASVRRFAEMFPGADAIRVVG